MSDAVRSGTIAFRPRARLLKLIGSELISDEVVAITELVKNSHDADATRVTIEFRGVTSGDGEIVIRDDGTGMDLDTLLGSWMEPAGSSKRDADSKRTRRGRRVLGEKGVGRFAVDKLARELELISRCKGTVNEIRAVFDWDRFESDEAMLSEIRNRWELRQAIEIKKHGTILRLRGIRSTWTERMFRRLSTRLQRLLSPFSEVDNFRISMQSDEFPEYSGELRSDLLLKAPYSLEAEFDGAGTISVRCGTNRPVQHEWSEPGELTCGPVKVRIFAFDLETEAMARLGPRMEVRAWLREWSGISIYRDGFRLWPYGEPHDDWLRLDQRRVNNPVVRLSNNQVVGFVELRGDLNPELRDQTNREGLIHNAAFGDLRRLLHFLLQVIEADRQSVRHPTPTAAVRSARRPPQKKAASIEAKLERIAARAPADLAPALTAISAEVREALRAEQKRQESLLEGYSDLAAAGQAAVSVARALGPALAALQDEAAALKEGKAREAARLGRALQEVAGRVAMLGDMESTLRRGRSIDLLYELEQSRRLLEPMLVQAGAVMQVAVPPGEIIRVNFRPESLHLVLAILTSNSLDWMGRVKDRQIRINVSVEEETCELLYTDNGPGVRPEMVQRIFEPRFSLKPGGRGMGLTIARNVVQLQGGTIEALGDARRKGAAIRLRLPRKRSRATVGP